jgi:hypothetical protein
MDKLSAHSRPALKEWMVQTSSRVALKMLEPAKGFLAVGAGKLSFIIGTMTW